MRFVFEVSNEFMSNTVFCEAEDLIAAVMISSDFLEKLNEKLRNKDKRDCHFSSQVNLGAR